MSKLTDFTNFTDSLPQQYTQKDVKALASKLKTYVNSTKFYRQGSTVDQYDQASGKRKKVPLTNVTYKQTPKDKGIKAQKLRALIYNAINSKDPEQLQQAASYKYFSGQTPQTLQDIKQLQRQQDLKALMLYSGFGLGGAAAGASIPYLSGQHYTRKQKLKDAMGFGALGGGAGLILANLIKG